MEVGIPKADPKYKVLGAHSEEGSISSVELVEDDCRERRGDATDVRSGGGGEGFVWWVCEKEG